MKSQAVLDQNICRVPDSPSRANARFNDPIESCGERNSAIAARVASTLAENTALRAEVEQLRGERKALLETQRTLMELLGCPSSEKILHDLRNLINERDLLRTLADEL